MDYLKNFCNVLEKTNLIALATAKDNVANVRIVSFCYDPEKPETLYFATERESQKVAEFRQNNKVALTTIPLNPVDVPHARSHNAVIVKSSRSIDDMADMFIAKDPSYREVLEVMSASLDVFEIHIKEVLVIVDYDTVGTLIF